MQLKDTGNRTDLGGSGALRDINPENGRCDLLPASAICDFMRSTNLVQNPELSKNPSLVSALHYIFEFIGSGDIQFLDEALYSMMVYHWYKDKSYSESYNISQDKLFAQAMLDLSIHYKNGAEKYSERNWERGLPVHSFIDSGIRHLCKEILEQVDEPHDIAVLWNLFGAIWTIQHYPDLNDMPDYKNKKENDNEVKKEAVSQEVPYNEDSIKEENA